MVSVERITHYANDLPLEAPRELMDRKPPDWVAWGWSSRVQVGLGRVCVWASELTLCCSKYSMRYRPELDLVLKDISLMIVRVFSRTRNVGSEVLPTRNRRKRLVLLEGPVLESHR